MKTNELRIGNYLLTDYDYLCEVELIHKKHFDCRELMTGLFIPNGSYKPIVLNEDWLLKFGFEKKTYQHLTLYYYSLKVLSHGEIAFHPKDHGFNLDIGTTTGYQFGTTNIKSVHQLQNLYFSLTGEELAFNPK